MDNKEIEIIELNNESIEKMIYVIRGKKVMLDFDLARIYGYSTKAFNQQVNRNIEKFPERYRFQLSIAETTILSRSQNVTTIMQTVGIKGGRVYLPYAFTEQGVYMLMTVLKGDLATKQSIALIDAFKNMKDYILENNNLSSINDVIKLTNQVNENTKRLDKIEDKLDIVMDNFIDPSSYKHYLILNGQRIESDIAYQSIYKIANKSLIIIDNYIDIKTLQLLKVCNVNINIIIISDNYLKLDNTFIKDFRKDTNINLVFKRNGKVHDRHIIIDYNTKEEKIYLCGGSSKDGGNKVNSIIRINNIEVYKPLINKLLENEELKMK